MYHQYRQSFNPKEAKIKLKTSSSTKDLSFTNSRALDLKPMKNYTGNIYKIRTGPSLHDSKHISRVCPTKIPTDKERLYEENINLKQMYNYINEENLRLRTRIIQLEKVSDKRPETLNSPSTRSSHLMENLKISIRDMKTEIQAKDKEIEDMRKYVRYTKMQEIEGELREYTNECMRLKRVIDDLLVEKNIVPQEFRIYDKIKLDNEEMGKIIKYFKETDKIKGEQIADLNKKINALDKKVKETTDEAEISKSKLTTENKRLNDLVGQLESEKSARMNPKEIEIGFSITINEDSSNIISHVEKEPDYENIKSLPEPIISLATQNFCEKIKYFLSILSISSKDWVKSINQSGIISKVELFSALIQDNIDATESEVDEFIKVYGENSDQILSSVLVELFQGCEHEILSISEVFEELKAKATNKGIRDLQKYLEKHFDSGQLSEADIQRLFSQEMFNIHNPLTVNVLKKHLLESNTTVSRSQMIEKFLTGFKDWVVVRRMEGEGVVRRIQSLLFDCYEDLICRLQEKTRFSNFISMLDIIQELYVHGLLSNENEECCAKNVIYFYSRSVKKVPYIQILARFYENNVDEAAYGQKDEHGGFDDLRRSINSFIISEHSHINIDEERKSEYNQDEFSEGQLCPDED